MENSLIYGLKTTLFDFIILVISAYIVLNGGKNIMDYQIRQRVLKTTDIFLNDRSTVRDVAKKVDCSKSTVHKDLTERLPLLDKDLFLEVKKLLEYNKSIRHLRGGEATKKRFLEVNKKSKL